MIGLLTSNFSLYHDLVNILRKRNIPFVSLTFDGDIPPNVNVIITTDDEKNKIKFDNVIVCKPDSNVENIIDKAIILSAYKEINLIFGIDPGNNIGVAVYGNDKLIRRFVANSPEKAVDFIRHFMEDVGVKNAIIRIGNGARLIRNRIINLLQDKNLRIEIVDESMIPCIDDDAIAASSIALTVGKEIKGKMSVEPREGEIKELQRISRIKSKNITISKELAKKVLMGEMELDEAIEIQRRKNIHNM